MATVQARAYGYLLTLETAVDLTSVVSVNLIIKPVAKRGGAVLKRALSVTDAAAGTASYITTSSDFIREGDYSCQVEAVFSAKTLRSKLFVITAEASL